MFIGLAVESRNLDPFHIKKAIRSACGDAIDLKPVFTALFSEGFDAVSDRLLPLNFTGKLTTRGERQRCFDDLKRHEDEILPLDQRSLPFAHFSSMGCIEANVGKLIALLMKSRGCSWLRAGAQAMATILSLSS